MYHQNMPDNVVAYFTVYGQPRPKGSWRSFISRTTGKQTLIPDNASSKAWQKLVTEAAREHAPTTPLQKAVGVYLYFFFERPATSKRLEPSVRPDVDKLSRAVLDGLTKAGMYRDDGQVCILCASKHYLENDNRPKVVISVEKLEAE